MNAEQAIHDILKRLETAWNTSDSRAWATHFADDATFIHIFGGQLDGRVAIEAAHRNIFDTIYKGSALGIELRSVRFVRPDVAVAFARMHLALAKGGPAPDFDTRPTLVVVKEEGNWQIVAFQNTRVSDVPVAAAAAAKLAT